MSDAVLAALITGALTLIGTIITVLATNHKTNLKLEVQQAVFDTKLEELTREVRKHNGFAEKLPVLEEKLKVANHRIEVLEKERRTA